MSWWRRVLWKELLKARSVAQVRLLVTHSHRGLANVINLYCVFILDVWGLEGSCLSQHLCFVLQALDLTLQVFNGGLEKCDLDIFSLESSLAFCFSLLSCALEFEELRLLTLNARLHGLEVE